MIFVILLCCLLGLGVFGYNLDSQVSHDQPQSQDAETQVNVVKEIINRKNYASDSGSYILSAGDLMSSYFIYGLINVLYEDYGTQFEQFLITDRTHYNIDFTFNNNGVSMGYVSEYNYSTDTLVNGVEFYSCRLNKISYQNNNVYILYFRNQSNANLISYSYGVLSDLEGGRFGTNIPFFACNYGTNTSDINVVSYNVSNYASNTFGRALTKGFEYYTGSTGEIAKSNYASGYVTGYDEGYEDGNADGEDYGRMTGYTSGKQDGYDLGVADGYQQGYLAGFSEADNMNDTALTIFTGIIDIGLLPVNLFLDMFNYEVFGVNVAGFVSSLLTVAIVIIIIRFVLGKKDD